MGISTTAFSVPVTYRITKDDDTEATARNNATGSSGTLYSVEVIGIGGADVYLKIYDSISTTTGTTVPYLILFCRQNTRYTCHIPSGLTFSSGISFACTTEAGVAGTSSPGSSVIVHIVST